jgi:hypothetical protein
VCEVRWEKIWIAAVVVCLGMVAGSVTACNSMHDSVVADGHVTADLQEPAPNQHETPIQSVNGKVLSISSTQLTLEVKADDKTDTMDFVIDGNTKTDGDIKPGIQATVDYQVRDGKKYAAHIMPAEAKKP